LFMTTPVVRLLPTKSKHPTLRKGSPYHDTAIPGT
jgi:hypothetical protein